MERVSEKRLRGHAASFVLFRLANCVLEVGNTHNGGFRSPLCVYNRETIIANNLESRAQEKSASLLIEKHGDTVRAIVEDDGIGFDVNAKHGERHLGLLGMRERAELLGGKLTIESTPERGTSVFIEIPLNARPVIFEPRPQTIL